MNPLPRSNWLTLEPLLDQALELAPEARSLWLADLSISSPELAADVEAFLAEEAAADRSGFLTGVRDVSLAGLELGAYRLERQLGQGGMGTVWLARRADGRFEGQAAVKLLNLALVSATGQERFRREGSVLARLTHPGIARLLDAGVSPAGQPYLVLEYVDGQPIDAYVRERKLPQAALLRLFLQVLAAVGHAHANLIVHRDLKPSNIFVTTDGDVKLLDFGIAKLIDDESANDRSLLTAAGGRIFTPQFAAPEQVHGADLTTATDVYALGVLLYLLLSDRHPTAEGARTPADYLTALLEVEPARLGVGDLDTILAKALRKAPGERYQTVAAFGDDIERYLRREPVSARPDSMTYRMGKFVRRNRGGVAVAALVTLALLGTTGAAVRQSRAAQRQRDEAVLGLKRQRMMNSIQEVILGDERSASGQPLSSAERLQMAARMLEAKYRDEPWLVADGLVLIADRYYESGDRVSQRALLARGQEIGRAGRLPEQLAIANCLRVNSFAFDELFDSAASDLAEAKAALASAAPNDVAHVACLDAEGQLLAAQGQWDGAIPLLTEALERASVTPETGSNAGSMRLQVLNDLALALRGAGRTRDATTSQRRIVAELEASGYGLTQLMTNSTAYLVSSLLELGEFVTTDSLLRPIIAEQEATRGVGSAAATLAYYHGANHLRLGQLDTAEFWILRSVRDDPLAPGANGGPKIWAPGSLTELRLLQGRVREARREFQRLPEGTFPRRVAAAWLGAWIRYAGGDSLGAARELEESIRQLDSVTPRSPRLALPLLTAAEWRLARGDWREADTLARAARACAGVDSLAFSRSGHVGRAELIRARALVGMGESADAARAAERAVVALSIGFGSENPLTRQARAMLASLKP